MNSIALLGLLLLAHSTNTFVLDLSLKHKNGFAGRVDPILSSSSLLSESSQRGEAHSDLRQRLDELAGSGKGADDLEKEPVLNQIQSKSLERGKNTLSSILNSGEVRALNTNIQRYAKEGMLDGAFFEVLEVNIRDALHTESSSSPGEVPASESAGAVTSRSQILLHVSTLCHESLESLLPPSAALVTRLMRSLDPGLRANILRDALVGGEAELPTGEVVKGRPKIGQEEFVESVGERVRQIRSLDVDGSAAVGDLVEVCKVARSIVVEGGGDPKCLEEGLQEVFKPTARP